MRRRGRKAGIVLSVLAIVLIAAAFGLPKLLDLDHYRGGIVAEIEKATGGHATLGRLAWGISTGLWVEADGLSISKAPGFPMELAARSVKVRLALRPLLSKEIVVTRIVLDAPDVILRLPSADERADEKHSSAPPAPGMKIAVSVEKLVLHDGRFRFEDAAADPGRVLVHTATDIDLTAGPLMPGRTVNFDLSLKEEGPSGLGPLKANGTFSGLTGFVTVDKPLLVADVSIPALQLEAVKPFLRSTAVIQRLSGEAGVAVRYTWDLGSRHSFDGTLDLARAAYTDPSFWKTPLSGKGTTVSFRMDLAPDRLTFEHVAVKRGAHSVAAHGVFEDLGGPKPRVTGSLRGTIPVDSAGKGEGAAVLEKTGWEDVRGAVDADLSFAFETGRPQDIAVRGRVALRGFTAKPPGLGLRLENLEADVEGTDGAAEISRLSAEVAIPSAASSGDRVKVSLQARVDGLRKKTVVTLRSLATGAIPLRAVSSLVRWEKPGDPADLLQALFDAGGTVTLERVALPPTELSKLSHGAAGLLSTARATLAFSGLAYRPVAGLPAIERVSGRASLEGGVLTAASAGAQAGPITLPEITVQISRLAERPRVAAWAKGPLEVKAASNADVQSLLRGWGLASLTGSANVDISAELNGERRGEWVANGSVSLSGVRAVAFPSGVVLDSLKGRLRASRRAALDISAEGLEATVDGAPLRLSGTLRGAGAPRFALDATASATGLDLAHAREFVPSLKQLGLTGRLDMDVKLSIPAERTSVARLNGTVSAGNVSFRLPAPGPAVTNGGCVLVLDGNAAEILRMSLQLDGHELSLTGRISNPMEPDVRLAVTAAALDLDRLLPAAKPSPPPSPPPGPRSAPARRSGASALPPLLLKTTATLSLKAKEGRFRTLTFRDLTLDASYVRGLLTGFDLGLGVGNGRIAASGSADLRDPAAISFVLKPGITALDLDVVAPLVGLPKSPLSGPVSLTGEIQGRAGRAADLLSSVTGNARAQMGPGRVTNIGKFGEVFAKILDVASAQRVLSGKWLEGFSREGLGYKTLAVETTFARGGLDVGDLVLEAGSMTLRADGRIDFSRRSLDMKARLAVLGLVDKVLGVVPLVGHDLRAVTAIPLRIKGPFDDAKVKWDVGQGTRETKIPDAN